LLSKAQKTHCNYYYYFYNGFFVLSLKTPIQKGESSPRRKAFQRTPLFSCFAYRKHDEQIRERERERERGRSELETQEDQRSIQSREGAF
jgi:hypothetical protein